MIAIGSDHNGFEMKEQLKKWFEANGIKWTDEGNTALDKDDDYPVYAKAVADAVSSGRADRGVLICGTGIGMMICANRTIGVRAVNSTDEFSVMRSRLHNDANVICLGASVVSLETAERLIDVFLNTKFEGGRHQRRLDMIDG